MGRIDSVEKLRAVVGEEIPGIGEKNIDRLDDFAKDFIARSPFLILSTADGEGRVDASPKGDEPGFVAVEDDHTLLIPDRPGNKLVYGHLNVLSNPQVGVLFMIPNTPETLRVNGRAELTNDAEVLDALAARGKPAVLALRVSVDECFFHCAKAFIRSRLWRADTWPERHRVSFGEIFAQRRQESQEVAKAIDDMVESDYKTNL